MENTEVKVTKKEKVWDRIAFYSCNTPAPDLDENNFLAVRFNIPLSKAKRLAKRWAKQLDANTDIWLEYGEGKGLRIDNPQRFSNLGHLLREYIPE